MRGRLDQDYRHDGSTIASNLRGADGIGQRRRVDTTGAARRRRRTTGAGAAAGRDGTNGGVSTGHPLTTAAAFEILLKGGNAFDAGVASLIVGGVRRAGSLQPRRRNARARLSEEGGQGHVDRRAGLGAEGASTSTGTPRAARRSTARDSIPPWCPARCTRALTVLEKWGTMSFERGVGARHRVRGAGLPDAAAARRSGHRAQPRVLQEVAGQPALLAEARRLDATSRARRSSCRRSRAR